MHLFSRYPLQNVEVKYRIKKDVPSITADVILTTNGRLRPVKMYFLHPMPPSPTESPTSLSRDQELILVAKEIAEYDEACIVAGDLNAFERPHVFVSFFRRTLWLGLIWLFRLQLALVTA